MPRPELLRDDFEGRDELLRDDGFDRLELDRDDGFDDFGLLLAARLGVRDGRLDDRTADPRSDGDGPGRDADRVLLRGSGPRSSEGAAAGAERGLRSGARVVANRDEPRESLERGTS